MNLFNLNMFDFSCKKKLNRKFSMFTFTLTNQSDGKRIDCVFSLTKKYSNFIVSFFSNDISKAHEIKN